MDFEAPNRGGNPFLTDDDFSMPADNGNMASNPFLTGDFEMPSDGGAELNPFLSGGQDDYYQQDTNSSSSTNPFAMFGVEDSNEQPFSMGNGGGLFGDTAPAATVPQTNPMDFFGASPEPEPPAPAPQPQVATADFFASPERPQTPMRPQPPVMAPSSLVLTGEAVEYCAETATIFQGTEEEEADKGPAMVPGRPPPPRPAPPSRETQQLILSVTGAMDATSSDLLDRLRATKTPSPTPIRDLHSPSPTPEMNRDFLGEQEPDFLMGDDTPAPPPPSATIMSEQPQTASNFMDMFGGGDDDLPPPPEPEPVQEMAPAPAPSTDFFSLFGTEEPAPAPVVPTSAAPPPRPPPVVVKPLTPPQEADLLGDFSSPNISEAKEIPAAVTISYSAPTTAAAPPPVPAPPRVPPRPPSPAVPVPATSFPPPSSNAFSPPAAAPIQSVPPPVTTYQSSEAAFPPPPTTAMFQSPPATTTYQAPAPAVYQPPPPANTFMSAFGDATAAEPEPAPRQSDDFDDFAAKFESAAQDGVETRGENGDPFFDPFGSSAGGGGGGGGGAGDAWGAEASDTNRPMGFGGEEDTFDAFLSLNEPPPVPQSTPARNSRQESADSDEGTNDFSIFIKPKMGGFTDNTSPSQLQGPVPTLAPPPKSPVQNSAFIDNTPRFNPFDNQMMGSGAAVVPEPIAIAVPVAAEVAAPPDAGVTFQRTDSQETPQTPLFDDDVSQPLEEFPRINFTDEGWEMHLRQPNKKKITGQRFWKKVFVRLVYQGDNPVLQLSNTKDDKDPFQELPLQPCYSISDIGAQQFDQYGKIFTVKLQYVFYKERPGVRPGQVTKAERITNKLSQFAAYAIQGDYQGVKEFGSDLRKLGLPVEHAPQISQLLKIGSQNYETMKQFSVTVEEALFRMPAHRDRALNYKMEEVQITAVDELYLEQDKTGHVCKQIARVRIFFLGFISGMPDLELGVNDIMRQGKEVVGRHDIIPVITEEWIRLEKVEFHSSVLNNEYEDTRVIKFKPPDACYIELLRFRVRPPKNRELPLQLKAVICVTGNKVEIKCDILVPGFSSRKLGQIPCEDIMVRIPIPESWIYLFRVEKHFRYGSVKSAHRRTGKIKGIERFLGTMETMEQSLIEVTSGSAKYEHQHHAIVWRISRLPKEGQGAYTNHEFVCRFTLTSYDQIPDELAKYCYLEFTMPSTQVSHTTVRSLSVCGDRDEDPPEKCVRHLARLEYRIEIEHTQGSNPNSYISATQVKPAAVPESVAEKPEPEKDSDSDSSS